MPLDILFTVDVEIWPGGWDRLDERFPEAFRRYIYGSTAQGDYGLPMTLRILSDSGLRGTFFVESLFARRFGVQPLAEIVGLIQESGHEVHLHLHPEWVVKTETPLFPNHRGYLMRSFSLEEQSTLVRMGLEHLHAAGGEGVGAFRAGGYALNADTLRALAANGIVFDTSYNPCVRGDSSGLANGGILQQPTKIGDVYEYPVSAFADWPGHLRHAQLGAASYGELTGMLGAAERARWESFVIVSHAFELLDRTRSKPDRVMVRRFRRLCRFLDRHRDAFPTRGFADLEPAAFTGQPKPIRSSVARTAGRILEQAARRVVA